MDAAELLNGGASFVIDTSAWWRLSTLPHDLLRALRDATLHDRMLTTPVVRMEILSSARTSAEYVAYDAELSAPRMLRNDRAVADTAMSALSELAEQSDGYHRVSITDALIAASAAEHGGLAVLHKDGHFDRLGEVLAFQSARCRSTDRSRLRTEDVMQHYARASAGHANHGHWRGGSGRGRNR